MPELLKTHYYQYLLYAIQSPVFAVNNHLGAVNERISIVLPFREGYVSYLKKDMEAITVEPKVLSPEAYLEAERSGSREDYGKFEYHNGELIEMGGATKEHNRVSSNLSGLLWQSLINTSYEVFHSDMRTYSPSTNSYFYPDLVVSQGEAQFKDDEFDNLVNPALVIEILSKSTSAKDRGVKFAGYRSIDTLQEYLLVASQQKQIEYYQRQQQNEWKLIIFQQDADELSLLDDQVKLKLGDIYRNVLVR